LGKSGPLDNQVKSSQNNEGALVKGEKAEDTRKVSLSKEARISKHQASSATIERHTERKGGEGARGNSKKGRGKSQI